MSTMPIDKLQLRALEERTELHRTISDLRNKVFDTREKLNFSHQAHRHLAAMSVFAGFLGVAVGYGVAGLFTTD